MPPQYAPDDVIRKCVSMWVKYPLLVLLSDDLPPLLTSPPPSFSRIYATLTCDVDVRDFFNENLDSFVEKQRNFRNNGDISAYETHDLIWTPIYKEFEALMETKLKVIAEKLGFDDESSFHSTIKDSISTSSTSSSSSSLNTTSPAEPTRDERSKQTHRFTLTSHKLKLSTLPLSSLPRSAWALGLRLWLW